MTELMLIAALALLAAALGALWTLRRMLALLLRLERAVSALAGRLEGDKTEGDAEQERYARGVANILAYGTRELLRKGGEAQ